MICAARGCDEPAIRSQMYALPRHPHVHLCAIHWMMADDDPSRLRKLLGFSDEGTDKAPNAPESP
jgi:hypothetical protein